MKRESHGKRDDLTGEHSIADTGQAVLAVLFIAAYVLDNFLFKYTTFLNNVISIWVRLPVGIVLLSAAGFLAKSGHHIIFKEKRTVPQVVKGAFIIRAPYFPIY